MQGYIHQLESFGSVDGPGVRFIIFFSGCPLRCKYCHNPDTWDMAKGKLYTADELLNEALSCTESRPYTFCRSEKLFGYFQGRAFYNGILEHRKNRTDNRSCTDTRRTWACTSYQQGDCLQEIFQGSILHSRCNVPCGSIKPLDADIQS